MMDKVKINNMMLRNRVKMKMIMMMVKISNMMTNNPFQCISQIADVTGIIL